MYNPLQQHESYYYSNHDEYENEYYDQNQRNQWDEGDSLRGGSTISIPEQPQMQVSQEEGQPYHPPKILLKHMSMALRVTCEWNRRLFAGVNRTFEYFHKKNRIRKDDHSPQQPPQPEPQPPQGQYHDPPQNQLQLEPYGDGPVNISPDRIWHPPIREGGPDLEQESLTIFHAMTPHATEEKEDSSKLEESSSEEEEEEPSLEESSVTQSPEESSVVQSRGVAHWGPELLPYLEQVTELLQIDNNGLEIALAMIYLDRACSVDTIRTNGCPPCPFCLPRTVHRLSLVALILAKQAVNGNSGKTVQEYLQDLTPLGIPMDQLELMTNWMINALGDNGSFVTVGQMKLWSEHWEAAFFPKRHRALQLQRQQEEQQRLLQQEKERLMQQQYQQQQLQQNIDHGYQQQQAYHQDYQQQQ